jgi:hypothetical protein
MLSREQESSGIGDYRPLCCSVLNADSLFHEILGQYFIPNSFSLGKRAKYMTVHFFYEAVYGH